MWIILLDLLKNELNKYTHMDRLWLYSRHIEN